MTPWSGLRPKSCNNNININKLIFATHSEVRDIKLTESFDRKIKSDVDFFQIASKIIDKINIIMY